MNAYRKAPTLPQWLEMVEARVQTLIPMAEQWVNIGRTERAEISKILRAHHDGQSFPPSNPITRQRTSKLDTQGIARGEYWTE